MADETPRPAEWAVGRLLAATAAFLSGKGSGTPRLDAELLLSHVLRLSKVQLYVNFERALSAAELDEYRELVRRRAGHEPVAYILGRKEFYGLSLKTTAAALIPRPETEHMVDEAVRLAREFQPDGPLAIADIGCGGGAVGLALAHTLPEAFIQAVDISPEALALAEENAAALKLSRRLVFRLGDLLTPLAGLRFHLICANLPYVPSAEMAALMPDVGLHEPHLALDGGREGLGLIGRLLASAPDHLLPGGRVLLEIWPDSLPALERSAAEAGFVPAGEVIRDLAGQARIVVLRRQLQM
ncbi:MAG: peptide chain release factor N(5)-glutamine methyltransferase [Candidatus Adiutrix sp.]|jgi:release factor glutamine methyltransferase|nr:peptide chain release factor N(5)-glutamine methyltransferase [Candidatus Adiutrix sp.]